MGVGLVFFFEFFSATHTSTLHSPFPPPGRLALLLLGQRAGGRSPRSPPTLQFVQVFSTRGLLSDLVLELRVGDDHEGGDGHEGEAEGEAAWGGGGDVRL